MFPNSQEKNRKKKGHVLLPWQQKFQISKLFLGRDGHCVVKRWKERIGYKCKKEGRQKKHELKLYFTFTQKWSSTKYMLIFCDKWKRLHEKRVQSRQYPFQVYQHGRRVVLLLLFLFLFCSPCHHRRGRGQAEFPRLT